MVSGRDVPQDSRVTEEECQPVSDGQLVALLPPMITVSQDMQSTMKAMYSTFNGLINQIDRMTDTASAMGQAFDGAKSDDYFYLPPEAFDSPDFQRGLKLMLSPDGKSAQFIITHDVDPATPEGISHVDAELQATKEAVKGTLLADAKFYLGGTAATYKDIQVGAKWDLMIAAVGAITLIFMVMLIITRALIASFVTVGTVVLSLAASFGLSVLVWQYLIGTELHWMTLAFSVIILLAVGSDYNLLVVSRFKEEIGAGINSNEIQQAAQDQMHWFFPMDYNGRRANSEELAMNYADPLTAAWPDHSKAVAAHTTDMSTVYRPSDMSAWFW